MSINKTVVKVWTFGSSSNPSKSYETLQYDDGTTSCNCPGWTRRVASDGSRSCKHTQSVENGTADGKAMSKADYTKESSSKSVAATTKAPAKKTATKEVLSPSSAPRRRVQWQ